MFVVNKTFLGFLVIQHGFLNSFDQILYPSSKGLSLIIDVGLVIKLQVSKKGITCMIQNLKHRFLDASIDCVVDGYYIYGNMVRLLVCF